MNAIKDILFEEVSGRDGHLGLITLNRPQVLNALNLDMLHAIDFHLKEWEAADQIKAVVIRATEGRAFCAGGDIRSIYDKKMAKDANLGHFFRDEYRVDLHIYQYTKPFIALLDGITMGGGAGISMNGSHRVASDRLLFAMPETTIGFYPDVGASYFLSRLPYKIGFYLGLSSARIPYNDCASLGLVNHVVARESFSDILYALADASLKNHAKAEVTEIIGKYATAYPPSSLLEHKTEIESCFSKNTIEEILESLESGSEWAQQAAAVIKTKSPTSLKVTLRSLQEGEKSSFSDCMRMEYRLTTRFVEGHDFFEGVRAAIIDKDQSPHWQPLHLDEVTETVVDKYFSPLEQELV